MKIRRGTACALGVVIAFGLAPLALRAQSTSSTATSGNGTSSTSSSSSSGSSSSSSSGINLNSGSGLVQPIALQAITNTAASTTTSPSTYNNYSTTYVNPTSLGLPSIYASNLGPPSKYTGSMGKGLYLTNATTTSSSTGSTTTNAGVGFSTQPTPRSPAYYTVLGEGLTPKAYSATKVASELKQKFANSSYFKKGDAIQVEVANGIVLLRGEVASESERIRAEGMIRIMPGVNDVQNQLQVVDGRN